MELIIEKLVSEYMKLDEVEAITLAGSRASGRNDSQSDIDLDLFVTRAIPIAKRREIASRFSDCMEIGNEFLFWRLRMLPVFLAIIIPATGPLLGRKLQ